MKIGILTHPLRTNYGGNIQAWALQTVLERLGHSVEVFDIAEKRYDHSLFLMPIVWTKRIALKVSGKYPYNPFEDIRGNKAKDRKYKRIRDFIHQKIHRNTLKTLSRLPYKNYDAIIVGSDQIWRKDYAKFFWRLSDVADIFLNHLPDDGAIKIAYAASIGVDRWEFSSDETERNKKALTRFRAISVRELSAVNLLKHNTNAEATHVLDPTMLLNSEDYITILRLDEESTKKKVVSYILDPDDEKQALINRVIDTERLSHLELNSPDKNGVMPAIEDWIGGIANAEIVVTDSFHGCVFSLIFKKRLIFVRNKERGNTRFDSLIETFGIKENIVDENNPYDPLKTYKLPENLDKIIKEKQNLSLSFISEAINGSN